MADLRMVACFKVSTGDVEDAPALDAIAKFDILEKDGGVYIKGEEQTIKASRRQPNTRCSAQGQEKVVVVGGFVHPSPLSGLFSILGQNADDVLVLSSYSGSGAMGAVQALREESFKGSVTIISAEPNLPIDRTKLSKALIADASKLELRPKDWYSQSSIDLVSDEVSAVDFSAKKVSTAAGKSYPYTKLILATGGVAKALPLPGFKDLNNVFLLRTVPDVQAILKAVGEKKGKKIVVVGSSFIGMEVGNALSKENSVSIVGMESAPLERVMGAEVGKIFQTTLSKNGVKFYLNASVDSATPSSSDSKAVGAVKLKDGTTLDADLVILGIGVAPATNFLKDNPALTLEKDGSLQTDESFAVKGLSDVYAIGDIATYPYHGPGSPGSLTRIEHWDVAQNAGRSVGVSIATNKKEGPKRFIPVFWSALGSQLRYCGNTPNGWDDMTIQGEPENGKFAAFYGKAGETVAVASMMMDPIMTQSAELMRVGKMPGLEELKGGLDVRTLSLVA